MSEADHRRFMEECLRLAAKGRGYVSPNPMVGAVLVKGGRIIARGFHSRFGGPHAEVECLRHCSGDIHGATLYVNLEPCSHHGKTPPCTDLIIESGISRVVVGMKDPNPLVNGRGMRHLQRAGVKVISNVLEVDARRLNRPFITYVTKDRPFVHLKVAQSLDGKIAPGRAGRSRITGHEARVHVHQLRAEHDAVLVGAGTVHIDNPLLTVRMAKGKSPAAVVLDGHLSLNANRRLWRTAQDRRVLLLTSRLAHEEHPEKVNRFSLYGIEVIPLASRKYSIAIREVLKALYRSQIASVLIEGGSSVFSQFATQGPIDRLTVFLAPRVYGNGIPAFRSGAYEGKLQQLRLDRAKMVARVMGRDILLQYDLSSEN